MRNSTKQRMILLLTCLLFGVFLPGCRNEASSVPETAAEDVQLSNLKTPASALSREEKAMLDAVQALLKKAEFDRNGNYLSIENTTKQELTLTIRLAFFDEAGTYKADASIYLAAWQPGERALLSLSGGNGYYSYIESMSAQIFAEFPFEGTILMTEMLPVSVTERLSADNINIEPERELPLNLTAPDSVKYRVEDVAVFEETVVLKVTKLNGTGNDNHTFSVRLVEDSGLVVFGDAFSDNYMKPGETDVIYLLANDTKLTKGNYTLYIDCVG